MREIKLKFRCKLLDGSYFNQEEQYLNSFLRRATSFIQNGIDGEPVHESYLDKNLEDYLEIFIDGEWCQCKYNKS